MRIRHPEIKWLAIVAIALSASVQSVRAVAGNPNAAKPHKLTVAQADDMVVHLANDVFSAFIQSKNTHLSKHEFAKAQDHLRKDMVVWAQDGRLRQILKSGWKPTNIASPDTSAKGASGTGMVDVAKIEKALKVSLPEFTDYTRNWVDKAMHELPAESQPKVANPHPGKHPPVRKPPAAQKKVVKQAPPAKPASVKKAAVVKTVKTTTNN